MIFVKLSVESFGDDPIMAYSEFYDSLIKKHTQNVFEAYQQSLVTIQYPDGIQRQLDDEVSRYADDELSFYSFEEKIDPSYYFFALNGRTEKGIERVSKILNDIRVHDAYRGRVFHYKIAAIVSDEPQCIPCRKKKLEERMKRSEAGI